MRLSEQQIKCIATAIKEQDADARIYLFGSRADTLAKGGDIDLLVISKKIDFMQKIKIEAKLIMQLGEQKIDLVISEEGQEPFAQLALTKAIEL